MVKVGVIACAILLVVSGMGCYGPMKITRQLDDWGNETYVQSPWLAQLLTYAQVFGLGYAFTYLADFLVLNPIDFWGTSMQRGTGTPFTHKVVTPLPGKRGN